MKWIYDYNKIEYTRGFEPTIEYKAKWSTFERNTRKKPQDSTFNAHTQHITFWKDEPQFENELIEICKRQIAKQKNTNHYNCIKFEFVSILIYDSLIFYDSVFFFVWEKLSNHNSDTMLW